MSDGALYGNLSRYYDHLCADIDYAEQAAFALRAFDCLAATRRGSALDLACGTGQHLVHLQRGGFAVTGLDNSAEMLQAAADRCPDADLVQADLAGFDWDQAFDLVTCFLYSLHYSHPLSALHETLRRARRALRPGGILLFDLVDRRGVRGREVVTRQRESDAELTFTTGWKTRGDNPDLYLDVAIRRTDAQGETVWRDRHTMTGTTIPEVEALLQQEGFEVTVLEHDFSALRRWAGESRNVIMIGRVPAPVSVDLPEPLASSD